MNIFVGVGRLTKDVDYKTTNSGKALANFSIAINRTFKNANGEYDADFIDCVAWGNTATFINSYFSKGSKIGITGSVQSRTYEDNNGNKRYVTEINVTSAEFVESKNDNANSAPAPKKNAPVTPPAPADAVDLPFEF